MAHRVALSFLVVAVGCLGSGVDDVETLTGLSNLSGGNPLNPTAALYPWPSDLYLVDDATSATGRSLSVPIEALPEDVDPAFFVGHDGFTRVPAILAYFPEGIDPKTLPDMEGSVAADANVMLVNTTDGSRVPLLVELDLRAKGLHEQSLILRPMVTLAPQTTYAVLMRSDLRAADGSELSVEPAFRALRDDIVTDSNEVEQLRAGFEPVWAAAAANEVPREALVLAWAFTTRSEAQVVGPALSMQDQVMSADIAPWVETARSHDGDNWLIEGQMQLPDFLGSDGRVEVGADGVVVQDGTRSVDFLLTIPDTVTGPRPVVLFGHGFFSDQGETTWSQLNGQLQQWQMSALSTNFIGLNEADLVDTLGLIASDIKGLGELAEQQLQTHTHFTALARLVTEQLMDTVSVDGSDGAIPVLSGDHAYLGISNGGTQGFVIAATSPVIHRAALVVPGGGWSHMMQRAVQWETLGGLLVSRYPNTLELQIVLALSQQYLDPVDSLNYAPHLVREPFPGRPVPALSLHMAVGDAQVANVVTEWVARTADIPMVTPSPVAVPLLRTVAAVGGTPISESVAMVVYDEGVDKPPSGNLSAQEDNGTHETIRDLDVYVEQLGHFLETGEILQLCEGACDPD
jgi:hypothetical protein